MCNCKHLGKLVNQGATLCFANGGVGVPNCSTECPNYEKAETNVNGVLPDIRFVRGGGCEVREFTINGKQASVDDFGYAHDHGGEYKPQYGCADYRFEPNKYPCRKTLEKYGIELIDWFEIQAMLEDELNIGCCEYCY